MNQENCVTQKLIIQATPAQIFNVLKEVECWNQWTKSVTKITFLKHNNFALGGKVKVLQPKLAPAVWTITEITENKSFAWEKKSFGLKLRATHTLTPTDTGTAVTLQMHYEGFLAKLFYRLTATLTSQYLSMEITGLKSRCEALEYFSDTL